MSSLFYILFSKHYISSRKTSNNYPSSSHKKKAPVRRLFEPEAFHLVTLHSLLWNTIRAANFSPLTRCNSDASIPSPLPIPLLGMRPMIMETLSVQESTYINYRRKTLWRLVRWFYWSSLFSNYYLKRASPKRGAFFYKRHSHIVRLFFVISCMKRLWVK